MAEPSKIDEVDPVATQDPRETPAGQLSSPAESGTVTTSQTQPVAMDEASRLEELQADVRNQDDLERDITRQVSPTVPVASHRINLTPPTRPTGY